MIIVMFYPSLLNLDSNLDLASQEIKSTWQVRLSIQFLYLHYKISKNKKKKIIIHKNSLKETFWGYKLYLETLDDDYDAV